MAVEKMNLIDIVGDLSRLDEAAQICGRSGAFQPENPTNFYGENKAITPLHEENKYAEPLSKLNELLSFIDKTPENLEHTAAADEQSSLTYVQEISEKIAGIQEKISEKTKEINDDTQFITPLRHFIGLQLDLDEIRKCKFIKTRLGSVPSESIEKINSYDENPYIIFFTCSKDEDRCWGFYFCPIESVSDVDRIFASFHFERETLSHFHGTPELMLAEYTEKIKAAQNELEAYKAELSKIWEEQSEKFSAVYNWIYEMNSCFEIRKNACSYDDMFILTGWVPKSALPALKSELLKVESIECTVSDGKDALEYSPPVKLKNSKLSAFFEMFVNLYGLPSYDETDPTSFVAFTYVLLFGIMFGDLGQGLLLSAVGYLMWKLKRMQLGKILIPCGISSAVFGTVFGSCFGFETWLNPFYKLVFGLDEKPIDVMNPTTTNYIIYSAVGIGIFLILTAMVINIITCFRRKHLSDALFGANGIAGFVFYGALILGLVGSLVMKVKIFSPLYITLAIVLPLLLIFFKEVLEDLMEHKKGALKRKWGEYIIQNFFELFELMLTYAGNTISFLRVGAFVLVHSGMMLVVFTLAEMSSGIGYIIIVVIGNIFVLALEGLLVGIQVLRLEFYEMFSRFFEGGGRPFTPVVAKAAMAVSNKKAHKQTKISA